MSFTETERTKLRLSAEDPRAKDILDELYYLVNEDTFSSMSYGLMFLGLKGSGIVEAFRGPGQKDMTTFIRLVRERNPVLDQYRNK